MAGRGFRIGVGMVGMGAVPAAWVVADDATSKKAFSVWRRGGSDWLGRVERGPTSVDGIFQRFHNCCTDIE